MNNKTPYQKKQFNACVFNPLCEEPMLSAYPQLKEIIDHEMSDKLDDILRFIVIMYDPGSPIIKDEPDRNYRIGQAANIVGIEDTDLVSQLSSHAHPYAPLLIGRYLCRFAKSKEWAIITALEYSFWEAVQKIMEPIKGDSSQAELGAVQKKAQLKDELDKDIARLDKYYGKFFGDSDLENINKKKRITPETMAARV